MSEGSDLAEKFVQAILRKGITPIELFEEYDKTGRGVISLDSFDKLLRSINYFMDRRELELLRLKYSNNQLLDYRKLCADMGPRGSLTLERTSSLNLVDFAKFAQKLHKDGTTLYDYMKGFDTSHSGKVSLAVFLQAVGASPLLMSVVKPYYNQSTNEVNYVQMQRDLDRTEFIEDKVGLMCPLPNYFGDFAAQIKARGIHIIDELEEHDPLRRGNIPKPFFLAAIGGCNLPFSPYQLEQITKPFENNGYVNYYMFLDELKKATPVNNAQTDCDYSVPLEPLLDAIKKNLQSRKLHLRDKMGGYMEADEFYRVLQFSEILIDNFERNSINKAFVMPDKRIDADTFLDRVDPKVEVIQTTAELVLQRLRHFMEVNSTSLLPILLRYDRELSHQVTANQLSSALNELRFPVTHREIQQIAQMFGNGNVLNYDKLCQQVEIQQISTATKKVYAPPETPEGRIRNVLAELYHIQKEYNFDIRGDLIRADPRKRGVLTHQQFRNILRELPMNLASQDFCALVESYTDPYSHLIYYNKFCDDIEQVGSTITLPPRVIEEPEPEPKQTSFIDSIKDIIIATLNRVAVACQSERSSISDLFRYYDKEGNGFVPTEKVIPIFRPFDKYFDDTVYEDLIKYFTDQRMPELFNWKKLHATISEIEPSKEDVLKYNQYARNKMGRETYINGIYNTIRSRLAARRKRIDDLFIDVLTDTITEKDFRNRLEKTELFLEENVIVAIIHQCLAENGKDIKWKEFCDGVTYSSPINTN